jgi:hypothetical protein
MRDMPKSELRTAGLRALRTEHGFLRDGKEGFID